MKEIQDKKLIITLAEPGLNPSSEELADIIIKRLGIGPRKINATEKLGKVLLELYERTKNASKQKNPSIAIMTVEEMALYAGITRQTMYDYIKRWLYADLIVKSTYVDDNKKWQAGYKLNGPTLESAFEKYTTKVNLMLSGTNSLIIELQKAVKNEKISAKLKAK